MQYSFFTPYLANSIIFLRPREVSWRKGVKVEWFKGREVLLTPEASAKELSISRAHLYRLLARGEIKSVLVGRSRRIPFRAIEQYVEHLMSEQNGDEGTA